MATLRLYNTASKIIEDFIPLNPPTVTLYACGPTVYDKTHIGHMRKYIGDDILRRTLSLLGYKVQHVMNITDVGHLTNDDDSGDDKLEGMAAKEGLTVWDVAREYTEYFHMTMRAVGVLVPTVESKATDHIADMRALIEKLFEKGYAYETEQAIYFDTTKDKDYGKLSGQKLSEKETGVREDVVTDPAKKNPTDFSLWFYTVGKFSNHQMHWPSPLHPEREGFPGWHIECSAMSMRYLGETIDIHTGGIDHIPVHHENEIAQSECATGHQFVRYWVHYDFLNVDGEKMSKSKGNFYTVDDVKAKDIDPLAVRLLCMQTSYRKPLNFTWSALEASNQQLKKLRKFARVQESIGRLQEGYQDKFVDALCEDMNTAKALATLWELLGDETVSPADKWATILLFDSILGLSIKETPKLEISDEVQKLLTARDESRVAKNYALSDTLRKKLEAMGYEVLDTPEGTKLL